MKETAKVTPMVEPMIGHRLGALGLAREVGRHGDHDGRTAPAPCSTRPAITAQGDSAHAQAKLPAAKMASPT
jgi:hypothetical protein